MKKVIVLVVASSVFWISCAGSTRNAKARLEPDGFRDIRWGSDISALGDMEKVDQDNSSNGELVWYIRKNDILAMGSATFENIFYSFWMGNFESVWIEFKGEGNFETLKKELFERFGKPRESGAEKTENEGRSERLPTERAGAFYAWWGQKTDIFLSYSRDRHKGTLTMTSRKVREERKEYEREKEKEKRTKERRF